MNDYNKFKEEFSSSLDSLKNLSFDNSNNEYMTNSEIKAYNFDFIKRAYTQKLHKSEEGIKSSDGLWILDEKNQFVFIEFKNGNVEKNEIFLKMRDSLLIFCDFFDVHISNTRNNTEFVVVYNKNNKPIRKEEPKVYKEEIQSSQSRDDIKDYFLKKAKKELVRWGLEKYIGIYFKDVHTYDCEEFEKYLLRMQIV